MGSGAGPGVAHAAASDVDALLRKYLWIVDLVIAGLCAVFLGRAAASAFESRFLSTMPTPKEPISGGKSIGSCLAQRKTLKR